MEQHSRDKAREIDDIRKGNMIATNKLEFSYPEIPKSHADFKVRNKKGGNKRRKDRKK